MIECRYRSDDDDELVSAVDTAFMSCSLNKVTPLDYLDPHGPNVLWELRQQPQTDVGFHSGANVSMLSQYACEDEGLFPPCTLMKVMHAKHDSKGDLLAAARAASPKPDGGGDPPHVSCAEKNMLALQRRMSRFKCTNEEEADKVFLRIEVEPCFV